MNLSEEVWLRGPVAGVPALLQPVAHALLQAREEVQTYTQDFSEQQLWEQPAGVASVGFHLQHLHGILDRLTTYARGESLTAEQRRALQAEGEANASLNELLTAFSDQIDRTLEQLRSTPETILAEPRRVGRQQLPSTVLGLLFHAAEHTQRHVGQLLVTVRILQSTT